MTFVEARYSEHNKYPEFLAGFGNPLDAVEFTSASDEYKQNAFNIWLRRQETLQDIEDFKNLVPMHIRMSTEEWNWFKARLEEEHTEHLPNLRALAKHPPASFKDIE